MVDLMDRETVARIRVAQSVQVTGSTFHDVHN